MKSKLTSNIVLRVDDELKARLDEIQKNTGISISEVIRQSLNSFVEYYDAHNCVTLPIVIVPAKELKRDSAGGK